MIFTRKKKKKIINTVEIITTYSHLCKNIIFVMCQDIFDTYFIQYKIRVLLRVSLMNKIIIF